MKTFSIKEVIKSAFDTFKTRWAFFIGVTILIGLISVISGVITGQFSDVNGVPVGTIGWVLKVFDFVVVQTIVGILFTSFYLLINSDARAVTLKKVFSSAMSFEIGWKYFITLVLMLVMIGLGLMLLVVPGIILSLGLMFAIYIVVDKKVGPIIALKKSWEMTKGHKGQLFLYALALFGLNLLGLLAFVVGLLATVPISGIASVKVYRILERLQVSE